MDSMEFELQPLQYMTEGVVMGCGARLFGTLPWGGKSRARGIDVSVNLRRESGFVKALSYDVTLPGSAASIRAAPIDMAWLRASGSNATKPVQGKPIAGETVGSILYVANGEDVADVLIALLKRQSIQIGVKRTNESGERIFYGKARASEADLRQLDSCLREVFK